MVSAETLETRFVLRIGRKLEKKEKNLRRKKISKAARESWKELREERKRRS